MIIKKEIYHPNDFEFWSGANYTVDHLTYEELITVFNILGDSYPEGMTDTELNDFFWFETDTIAEWLGYRDWEELENPQGNVGAQGHRLSAEEVLSALGVEFQTEELESDEEED